MLEVRTETEIKNDKTILKDKKWVSLDSFLPLLKDAHWALYSTNPEDKCGKCLRCITLLKLEKALEKYWKLERNTRIR